MPYISKHETDQLIGRMVEREGFTEKELLRIVAPVRFPDDPTARRKFIQRAELARITEREKEALEWRSQLRNFFERLDVYEQLMRSELRHSQLLDLPAGFSGEFSGREIVMRVLDLIAKLRKKMSREELEAALDVHELHSLLDDLHYRRLAANLELQAREEVRR